MSIEATPYDVDIAVDDPLEWSIYSVLEENRICISFNDYMIPLSESLFTKMGLQLPFSKFELGVYKNLEISISQIFSGSWVYVRVFELCTEFKSWWPSIGNILLLFSPEAYFLEKFHNQGLIQIHARLLV